VRYFAQIVGGEVTRVIVADSLEWCRSRLGGEWIETRDPYAETQADPALEAVNYCGPGHGADPVFPERFAPQWVQPAPDPETGEWSSYPKGRVVAHNGKLWKSTIAGNVWEPGVSAWHDQPDITGVDPTWIQPTGSHDTYALDTIVQHNGKRYKSLVADNVWEPGTDPALWEETDADGNPVGQPQGDTWTDSGATFEGVVGGGVINVSDTSVFQTPEPIRIGTVEVNATSVWTPGAPGILAIDATPTNLQFSTPNGTPVEVQRSGS